MLPEYLARKERHLAYVVPRRLRLRIEVNAQLIGMVHVSCADWPWIQVDAAEVDDPCQTGCVGTDDLVSGATTGELDRRCLDPGWTRGRRALLVERLALGAIRESLQVHRALGYAAQRGLGDAQVVVHQIELGLPETRKEHLVGIGDGDLDAVELEYDVCAHAKHLPRSSKISSSSIGTANASCSKVHCSGGLSGRQRSQPPSEGM